MSRQDRLVVASPFEHDSGFDEQMYRALRKSPYWMLAIAFHLVLVVLLTMFGSEAQAAPPAQELAVGMEVPSIVEPPEPDDEDVEAPTPDDVVSEAPQLVDAPVDVADVTDTDSLLDESHGFEGNQAAPFGGPSNNGDIGVGGSAGGGDGLGSRRTGRRPGGARRKIDEAVDLALRWLQAHQSPDGGWECETFPRWCDGKPASGAAPDGAGRASYDVGVTGLALLAFLGAGYTNRSEGEFGRVVNDGLKYLRRVQDAEGCFGNRSFQQFVYNHAIAALAMVEAYGMTGSQVWKGPAQRALDFVAITRNPYLAWRYGVRSGENDLSVTGWMMMALKSAKLVNTAAIQAGGNPPLQIDEEAFEGVRQWVDRMTDATGRAGYQERGSGPARTPERVERFPQDKSEAMTAVAVLARVFLGEDPANSEMVRKGADLCTQPGLLPKWADDGSIDVYYWYYGTLAMFQVGGRPWDKWRAAMEPAVLGSQRLDGDFCSYRGSWDAKDPWSPEGGRVYTTAAMALCLEVYYRYDRVFGAK